jgi:dCTP deaminase
MGKWDNIKPGILVDWEIKELCPDGLITGNYDPKFVKQTCYELRVGKTAWYTYRRNPEYRKVSIEDQGGVHLFPNAYVTIMTMEELEIPKDCVARIMTKGQLFSLGIAAVNTYADPGFSGPLGITLMNHSNRNIFIPIGEPIAKIEFVKLNRAVKDPYKGPHLKAGRLWPIPDSYYNIPLSIATQRLPDELKELSILEIEDKIRTIETKLTQKTQTIIALFIVIVPLIISSVLYWISNWSSMTPILKTAIIITTSVMATLAIVTNWWKSISGFLQLFRKKNGKDEHSV